LQDFAYRVELSWQMLVAMGLLAIAVAALAVSYQSVQAARTDPGASMRYE